MTFIGRQQQLAQLDDLLHRSATKDDDKPGRAVLIRGRRRVGKSRMVEEFIKRAGVPHVFFACEGRSLQADLELFAQEVAASDLPGAADFAGAAPATWTAALRALVLALPEAQPCIVAFDELPYLIANDPGFEGALQSVFDRHLSKRRVLFIGIGSDLAMMEGLNTYNRPFYQRATEMVVPPLSPAEVGDMLDLSPADAFDAYLITGGLPLVLDDWPRGCDMWGFLKQALQDPTSALLVSAERTMAAEFPTEAQAKEVLTAIGGRGERTFSTIGQRCGITAAAVSRGVEILTTKRLVTAARPLCTRKLNDTRYRVEDPYLRFWLTFLAPSMQRIERGSVDPVLATIKHGWDSWRGRAIEPLIHEGLERLELTFADEDSPGVVGSYWTRSNTPEIDIVVADRKPVAHFIYAIGSIKWRADGAFTDQDLGRLLTQRGQLPGAHETTPLVVVSRNGSEAATVPGLRNIEPAELIDAWRQL